VHLAFVIDPQRSGIFRCRPHVAHQRRRHGARDGGDCEANRTAGITIRQFIFTSSVSAYGSDLPEPVAEDAAAAGHTLPYAIHKRESDLVVQRRAPSLAWLRSVYSASHIFGRRGLSKLSDGRLSRNADGKSSRAERIRKAAKRLPCMLPYGQKYLDNKSSSSTSTTWPG